MPLPPVPKRGAAPSSGPVEEPVLTGMTVTVFPGGSSRGLAGAVFVGCTTAGAVEAAGATAATALTGTGLCALTTAREAARCRTLCRAETVLGPTVLA